MSYKSSLAALCAITSLLIAASGCGGNANDDDTPAAPPAPATSNTSTPYDGIYETRLTPAAARKIPDPAFTAGTYRLILGEGKYAIHGDRGPYGGGPLTASSGRLRFGPNRDAGCTATASYTATLRSGTLRLRALDDGCKGQGAFLERRWRRR